MARHALCGMIVLIDRLYHLHGCAMSPKIFNKILLL